MKPALVLVLALGAASLPAQSVPCLESSIGANLALGDDQVAQGLPLGFAFPFGGTSHTEISVSSNGFLWLGRNGDSGCCNGSAGGLVQAGPRIAPLWADLDPGSGGSVHFQALPGRAVVTWSQVPEYGGTTPLTVQVQLVADGTIVVHWEQGVTLATHTALAGVSPGNGAADPGGIDYTNALPFDTGAAATVYEAFQPATFDLGGTVIQLTPNGRGGYGVDRRTDCGFASFTPFGQGCPAPSTVYETYAAGALDLSGLAFDFTPQAGGGYAVTACTAGCLDPGYASGTDLGLADDAVAASVALGFAFPFAGGSTSAIDVASNGCVYLVPGAIAGSRCCNGDVATFLAEAASIGVLWLDLNPQAGGAVRTHQPNATTFVVTWDRVPEYGQSAGNTAQLALFADGRFRLAYGSVSNVTHAALVGFTVGGGVDDPGPTDLSAAVPFRTGSGGTPLALFASTGPVLGASFDMVVGPAPLTSRAGLVLWGFSAPAPIPLDAIGMPGCALFVAPDVTTAFPVQGVYSVISSTIPSTASLLGAVLFAQTAIVAPGTTPLGVVASNAGRLQLGR